jgi:hypothetical protein
MKLSSVFWFSFRSSCGRLGSKAGRLLVAASAVTSLVFWWGASLNGAVSSRQGRIEERQAAMGSMVSSRGFDLGTDHGVLYVQWDDDGETLQFRS